MPLSLSSDWGDWDPCSIHYCCLYFVVSGFNSPHLALSYHHLFSLFCCFLAWCCLSHDFSFCYSRFNVGLCTTLGAVLSSHVSLILLFYAICPHFFSYCYFRFDVGLCTPLSAVVYSPASFILLVYAICHYFSYCYSRFNVCLCTTLSAVVSPLVSLLFQV